MQAVKPNTAVVGNIGVSYSGEIARLTKDDWVVAEISSFQMEKVKTFLPTYQRSSKYLPRPFKPS